MQEQDIAPTIFSLAFTFAAIAGIVGLIAPGIFRFGRPQRPSRKRIAFITFAVCMGCLIGVASTVPETPEMKARAEQAAKERVERAANAEVDKQTAAKVLSPESAVISTVEGHNIPRIKRSVVVRLSREISRDDLVALGTQIRDRDSSYERVFIEYYLPGMRENAGAWAVTHWAPKLDARILGREQVPSPVTAVAPRDAASGQKTASPTVEASEGAEACVPTHQTAGWEFIENNAVRLADAYAAARILQAVFAFARPVVRKQLTGKNKGRYMLTLIGRNELMQLEPLFDFCAPAEKLDDEGDLWRVVFAKYGEKEL